MRSLRAPGLVLLISAAAAGRVAGQSLNPNSLVAVPRVGHTLAEAAFSTYRAQAFVGRGGDRQRFPGDLEFTLGLLRLSYSPVRNFALGVALPYRWTTYDDPGLEASFRTRGAPGLGAFVDWSPESQPGTFHPAIRLEYYGARDETDQILTVSDGVTRLAATFQVAAGSPKLPAPWTATGSLRVEYGNRADEGKRPLESRLQLQAGPRLARLLQADIHALAVAGYRASSAARQEGNFLHNRTSQGAFTGLLLAWGPVARGRSFRSLSLSALRDVRPRNALSGWRFSLALTSGF